MTDPTTPLRDAAFMEAFLDLVIPPSDDGRMPGAGGLGIASELADKVEADHAVGRLVQAGLKAVDDAALARDPAGFSGVPLHVRVEIVDAQLGTHPMLMLGLSRHLYEAYYQHPRVLEGLGEPPRAPFPEGYDLEETDPQLLEKLLARRVFGRAR